MKKMLFLGNRLFIMVGERKYKYGMGEGEEETCYLGFELELSGQTYKNHKYIVCVRVYIYFLF